MVTRIVRIPLNQTVKRYLSSGDYNYSVNEALDFLDNVYSYFFRYPWLLEQIESGENTQGAPIDLISSHPVAGIAMTLIVGVAAAITFIEAARSRKKAAEITAVEYQENYHRIKFHTSEEKNDRTRALNAQIEKLFRNNTSLQKKYEEITITGNDQVEFTLKNEKPATDPGLWGQAKNQARSVLFSSWVALCICSFVYWILWIGAGVVTSKFPPVGVDGLGAAGFAVPLVAGALYPLLKIRSWYRNKFGKKSEEKHDAYALELQKVEIENDPRLLLQAEKEISQLFKMAILATEKARLQKELGIVEVAVESKESPSYVGGDEAIQTLRQGKWEKAAVTGLSTAVSTYINVQYGAIFIVGLLQAAGVVVDVAGLASGVGIVFIACSGLYGIYKAVQRYQEVEKYQREMQEQILNIDNTACTLEESYNKKVAEIKSLQSDIALLALLDDEATTWLAAQVQEFDHSTVIPPSSSLENQPSTPWGKVKKFCAEGYEVAGGALTGMVGGIKSGLMIARIATIVGTVLFVPCAAAILATPWTIGILVAVALVYGTFKAYECHQANKEKRAKVLWEQRAGKIELLKEQSAVAGLQIALLTKKKVELEQNRIGVPELQAEKVVPLPRSQLGSVQLHAASRDLLFAERRNQATLEALDPTPEAAWDDNNSMAVGPSPA